MPSMGEPRGRGTQRVALAPGGKGVGPMIEREEGCCPFLVPVVTDRLWMYPTAAYCHRPGARVRVPGARTLENVCDALHYRDCPGYQGSRAPESPAA